MSRSPLLEVLQIGSQVPRQLVIYTNNIIRIASGNDVRRRWHSNYRLGRHRIPKGWQVVRQRLRAYRWTTQTSLIALLITRQMSQFVPAHAAHRPFVLHDAALGFMEIDRWRAPVQHPPFEPSQILCNTPPRQMRQKRLAESTSAGFRLDIKVFEPNAVPALEGEVGIYQSAKPTAARPARRSRRRRVAARRTNPRPRLPLSLRPRGSAFIVRQLDDKRGGAQGQALGRSRGGFGTKLHAVVDALGLSVRFALGPGHQNDMAPAYELVAGLA